MDTPSVINEVEQVLNAPYPASLSNLERTLSHCPEGTVKTWAKLKPCQVSPILDVLVSRLNTDDIAAHCLQHLLSSKALFDALIRGHPNVLEAVCARQLAYAPSASTLKVSTRAMIPQRPHLLHTLPAAIVPPASYYAMLEVFIGSDETEPVAQWQERTYVFLANSTIEMLSNISDDTIRLCVHRWATLMRSSNCVESLYAAYIASRLQRHAPNIATTGSSLESCPSICSALRAWIEKCRSIFRAGQVAETVKNTLARILKLACDERCRTLDHADHAIILARNALNVAMISYDADWSKDTGPYTRKLAQKLETMPAALQLASLHILALSDIRAWFPDVARALRTTLHHAATDHQLEPSNFDVSFRIIHRCIDSGLAIETFDPFFQDLIAFLIEQCRPQRPATPKKWASLHQAREVVRLLQQEDRLSAVPRLFLQAVTTTSIPEWWPLNMSTPGSPQNCSGLQTCIHSDESLRQELCDNFSLLVLTSAAGAGYQLPENVVEVVKQRLCLRKGADTKAVCCYRPFVARRQLMATSPPTTVTSENWREYLQESLASSAMHASQLIEQILMAVTQDLQHRCDDVERPLQEARNEIRQLREHIQLLQSKLALGVAEKDSLQEALRTEQEGHIQIAAAVDHLKDLNSAIQEKLTEAEAHIAKVDEELDRTKAHHRTLLEAAEKNASAELEHVKNQHANKMTELEAVLSSQAQAASALETETAWLKEQMQLAKNEMEADHRHKMEEMRHRFEDEESQLQEQIESLRSHNSSRVTQIERLNEEITSKDRTVSEMDRKWKAVTDSAAKLESDLNIERGRTDDLAQKLSAAKEANIKLVGEIRGRDNELEQQAERLNEMENSANRWQRRCIGTEKALADAREREQGIQNLLKGGTINNGLSGIAGTTGRWSITAASERHSMQDIPTPVVLPRQPAGSLVSDDHEEANDYETKELRQ